ncbi:antibiotic biosynthesis monooxygenase [Polyangium sp. y55x31]|uniref:antibiotic biosynthesis monooxygenase n=1 Tax=Polyangium sp. y55x31 TaxID=3042688 RepID=UPI002482EDF2|nr:antibiotic biosynthesis monooxygenase [Polyangium sp. y55x31]MDI1482454.1 antibiotic biosynthesis monooxygenase [Polyangium sp. y55x31]
MYVVCVKVSVLADHEGAFLEATLDNARGTRTEPGNVRFDVLRASDDPTRFFLYEVYQTEADFKAHQQTAHYLRWKERVAPMMAAPRVGEKYSSVFPEPWA